MKILNQYIMQLNYTLEWEKTNMDENDSPKPDIAIAYKFHLDGKNA